MNQTSTLNPSAALDPVSLFAGGGEMGALMRQTDWPATRLGSVETWSPSLRMMVRFLLANRFPLLLWWGPDFCQLYNDAYRPILGTKHPQSLGQPVRECWSEIWHILEPLIRTPFEGGPATWMEDIPLEINRHGFMEETHFTIAYSPVPDETAPRGIGGVLATVHEISEKVVGERRTMALRDLGAGVLEERNAQEACSRAAEILANYPKDIPFSLIYLLDADQTTAHLVCSSGVEPDVPICSATVSIDQNQSAAWPFNKVLETGRIELVEDLSSRLTAVPIGSWSDPPSRAAVVPIHANIAHQLAGFMVAGLSPRLRYDDSYRGFLGLVSSQIATVIANARAYEEEKKRAEALAEIDRAKTAFFTNISHEFRTPLTLMLGPLEDLIAKGGNRLPAEEKQQVEVARRNALRLLKLVNTLLDFSRIEAGRVQAVYEATDLPRLTEEIASSFRSAMENAGLRFSVESKNIDQPIYVDRDMWEKIVLNLLSNAFKFTFEGEVVLTMKQVDGSVELTVRDTGIGIPDEEQGRVFERFHRIENTRARTYEGTGIGLALVHELAKLHGGTARVNSTPGQGSIFTVSIPVGAAHLPSERIGATRTVASTSLDPNAYLAEAQRWLSKQTDSPTDQPLILHSAGHAEAASVNSERRRDVIVIADDNADMRDYVAHLLRDEYIVHSVSDGAQALEAAQELRPTLVLADIMMPVLDGFGLLRAIRDDEGLKRTPVILLSARAGEESRIEGLQAGADDYLVKPFTARELIARVTAHIRMANLRQEAEERESRLRAEAERERHRLQELLTQAPAAIGLMSGPDHRWVYVNDDYVRLTGRNSPADFLGKTITESLPEMETQVFVELLDNVYFTGKPYFGREMKAILNRSAKGLPDESYWDFVYQPVRDADGKVDGILVHAVEVTDKLVARKTIEDGLERLRLAQVAGHIGTWEWDPVSNTSSLSHELHDMFGIDKADRNIGQTWASQVHPEDFPCISQRMEEGHRVGEMEFEYRYQHPERGLRWLYCKGRRLPGENRMLGIVQDITARKSAAGALERSERKFREFAESATIALHWVGPDGTILWANQAELDMLGYSAEEYIGRHIAQFHLDAPVIGDILTRLCRGEKLHECEARLRAKDGSIRHVLIDSSVLFEDGKFIHTRCFTRDITQRKLAEQALRESEKRFRAFVNASSDVVYRMSPDWTEMRQLDGHGFISDSPVPKKNWIDEYIAAEDQPTVLGAIEKAIQTKSIFELEHRVRQVDGTLGWTLSRAIPILDENGGVVEWLGAAKNITDRKEAEESLRRGEAELRELNAHLNIELAASHRMQQLSARLVQLDDFDQLLSELLVAAIDVSHAEMGNIQLFRNNALKIVVQRGFQEPFLNYFNSVHQGQAACGTALREAKRVVVEDVRESPIFIGSPALDVMLAAGARAVQSTPLISQSGEILGMFSTHYRTPRYPSESELRTLDVLGRLAAELIKRKQTEDALRDSEQRLRLITDASPIMVWMSGTDKLCYYFNKTWLEFVGRTLEQESGNGWAENVHPDDFEHCLQIYVSSFEARRPFQMEYRLRHHSGQYRWILDSAVPRHAPDGTFEGYVGGCLDIHEQKVASEKARIALEALHESEQRLRLAQQGAGIGTFEWNIRNNTNYWTSELESMHGLPEGTFQGTQEAWERLIHPDDRASAIKKVELAFQTGLPVHGEWRVIWPDGSIHWILGRWQVFKDESGKPLRMAGINIDVTQRKIAEEARSRLAAIVESSGDAIISKDLNGIIKSWNRQAERLFGYQEEEIIGRSVLAIIPPELHRDEEMILTKIKNGETIDHFETVRITKSGEGIEVSLSISPIRDGQGNIVGAAKIARDIRTSKKIEQALRTTEKLAAAGRLAATVAHEINNPLEAISNLVFLAKRDARDANKVSEHLRLAERELERVAHIARQTLGFYRDTSAPIRFGVVKTIDDLLFLYEKRLEVRNIRIVKQYKNNAEITAFAGEIRQAFSNLITNAMDAMPSGGSLVIRVSEAREWSNSLQSGVRITIMDTGTGIEESARKSLFEPFFTTKADVGTGLGLWITKNIIEKHHGNIRFVTRIGTKDHGTAFSIFLPFNTQDHKDRLHQNSGQTVSTTRSLGAV